MTLQEDYRSFQFVPACVAGVSVGIECFSENFRRDLGNLDRTCHGRCGVSQEQDSPSPIFDPFFFLAEKNQRPGPKDEQDNLRILSQSSSSASQTHTVTEDSRERRQFKPARRQLSHASASKSGLRSSGCGRKLGLQRTSWGRSVCRSLHHMLRYIYMCYLSRT